MKKRYSIYIPFLLLLIDLLLINTILYFINDIEYLNLQFLVYINSFWIGSLLITNFYKIYENHNYFKLFSLLLTQFLIFTLGFFAFFSLFREGKIINNQTKVLITTITSILIFRILFSYALKKYRAIGYNFRKVIVLGYDESTDKLIEILKKNKELGYRFAGYFTNKKTIDNDFLGTLEQYENYILNHNIDEIFCSLSELKNNHIKNIKKFASQYNRRVKLIPNPNELYYKNVTSEYYDDSLLILKVKKLPFELIGNRIIKRTFDLVFSLLVCLLLISWLYPLLWILIKIESRGPAIFKQRREGFIRKEFVCYKFRSMYLNTQSDNIHTGKNDRRITKIGAFIRKTSLDEIPQFFNVILGDMSVIGPRPHLRGLAVEYQKDVENYLERHSIKPGITGLAQVSGYRGEIKKKSDIKNRTRLDIFYIENWSFLLDIKIIIKTILNIFKGDQKAY